MAEGRRRKNERALPSEEKREGKSKKLEPVPWKGPLLSLLYVKGSKLHEVT
jgi:hypothetical protein